MRVLVTGGCGYKGSVLVPKLLAAGHEVTVVDAMWFGCSLTGHHSLTLVHQDIRDGVDCVGQDAVIHLAGIANDPCGELDAKLTWEVNVLAHMRLCDAAARAGVKQFIFASSSSVYGIKAPGIPIDELATLEPVSDYNKTKMVAERVLMSYGAYSKMIVQMPRPATVCGMSPRMRLDVMVNMLTMQALENGVITAHCGKHGGQLMRPNIHIDDITDLYVWLLDQPTVQGVFNATGQNLSALDTAELIRKKVPGSRVEITEVEDKRSYSVSSNLLTNVYGFKFKRTVEDAVDDIIAAHKNGFCRRPHHMNLGWMRQKGLVTDHA